MRPLSHAAAVLVVVALPATAAAEREEWLGRDKALHLGAGIALSVAGYGAGSTLFDGALGPFLLGGALALAAGGGKELVDLAGAGQADYRDFVATAVGALIGLLVAWVVDVAISGAVSLPRSRSSPALVPTGPGAAGIRRPPT